jgi:toxin ParE1/3/4
VSYWLHPEAAEEHKKQVAYYEEAQAGLGRRYHDAFLAAVSTAVDAPHRFAVVHAPDIRRTHFKVFHFDIIYREINGSIQVLAVAHHRRQPGYWSSRAD